MTPARASIFTALFNLLKVATGVTNAYQRFVPWDQVPASDMPVLLMWERGERYEWRGEMLARVTLLADAIIYTTASEDLTAVPVQTLDNLLDAIDVAMAPSTTSDRQLGRLTLGGLVYNCRVEGEVVKASGDIDGVSALIVPFRIVVGTQSFS